VQPQVTYRDGQLSIIAQNSTLGDILRAVHKQTSAEMEVPANATERVVTHLGPGPARDVVAQLLNGSRFNYVLLGSPADASLLTRVVLVAKSGPETPAGANTQGPQATANQIPNMTAAPEGANVQAEPEPEAADESADENPDQAPEAEQPPPQEQPGVKTPQQLLQEMQQRQLQMQQQQPQGQTPNQGYPPPVPPRQPQQPEQQ
jgi:hypothetical protein